MAANKGNVTKRSDVNRPLKFEEGDANLQEVKNVIDDQQNFQSSQEATNSSLQSQVGTAQNDIDNHKSAADPHSQYYKDGDAIDDGMVTTGSGEQTVSTALNQRVIYVDTIADLQALPTAGLVNGQAAKLVDNGQYVFRSGDQSSLVAAGNSVLVFPNGDSTGLSGAWELKRDPLAIALEADSFHRSKASSSNGIVSVKKLPNSFVISRNIAGNNWLSVTLTNNGEVAVGVDSPFKVTNQTVSKVIKNVIATEGTQTGTWSEFTSNDPSPYIGHKSLRSITAGDSLTFNSSFSGDLTLVYVGDTDGGIADVTIDGVLVDSVDMYSETVNDFRQVKTVARNIPDGEHEVVITVTSSANPSSTGTQIWVNALVFSPATLSPTDDTLKPFRWEEGKAYDTYEEVVASNGEYYVTAGGGTSGSTEPTHTSGTVSDGGVDWTFIADSSFESEGFTIQAAGSELEYAYEIIPSGESTKEDVGGNAHGNEYLNSPIAILVDGSLYTGTDNVYGSSVELVQRITQFYGTYADNNIVGDVIQIHDMQRDHMGVRYQLVWQQNAAVGWFYSAMWPFLTYHAGGNYRKQFTKMATPQFSVDLSEYEGVDGNPIIGNKNDYIMLAKGRAYVDVGSSGTPSTDNGETGIEIALMSDYKSQGNYNKSPMKAGLAVNANSGQYTGFSSWLSKMYFQLYGNSPMSSVSIGETLEVNNRYYVSLFENFEAF